MSAAKELREWLAREERQTHRDEDMDTWTSWEELSPEQRQAVKARLLREAIEAEGIG